MWARGVGVRHPSCRIWRGHGKQPTAVGPRWPLRGAAHPCGALREASLGPRGGFWGPEFCGARRLRARRPADAPTWRVRRLIRRMCRASERHGVEVERGVRRRARRREGCWLGIETCVGQNARERSRVRDRAGPVASAAAAGTAQNVFTERPLQELGPRGAAVLGTGRARWAELGATFSPAAPKPPFELDGSW